MGGVGKPMKILMTGGQGMLAEALVLGLGDYSIFSVGKSILDITNQERCRQMVLDHQPEVIIHLAAWTDVEACEQDPERAHALHVKGTHNLVQAASVLKERPRLVYLSSTGVYGQTQSTPYCEDDQPQPTTVHHRTKYQGEQVVVVSGLPHLIIRTGWLFGGKAEHKKNFVVRRIQEAQGNEVLYANAKQRGNPTYIKDLSEQLKVLLRYPDLSGIFNCVGEGVASRLEYVQAIVTQTVPTCRVEAADPPWTRIAPVSNNESALNTRLQDFGLCLMRSWREALSDYCRELNSVVV